MVSKGIRNAGIVEVTTTVKPKNEQAKQVTTKAAESTRYKKTTGATKNGFKNDHASSRKNYFADDASYAKKFLDDDHEKSWTGSCESTTNYVTNIYDEDRVAGETFSEVLTEFFNDGGNGGRTKENITPSEKEEVGIENESTCGRQSVASARYVSRKKGKRPWKKSTSLMGSTLSKITAFKDKSHSVDCLKEMRDNCAKSTHLSRLDAKNTMDTYKTPTNKLSMTVSARSNIGYRSNVPNHKNTNNLGPVCDKEKEERIDYIKEAISANPKKDSAPGNETPLKNAAHISSSKSQMNSGNRMSKKLKNKACGTHTIAEKDSVTNESNGQVDFEPVRCDALNIGNIPMESNIVQEPNNNMESAFSAMDDLSKSIQDALFVSYFDETKKKPEQRTNNQTDSCSSENQMLNDENSMSDFSEIAIKYLSDVNCDLMGAKSSRGKTPKRLRNLQTSTRNLLNKKKKNLRDATRNLSIESKIIGRKAYSNPSRESTFNSLSTESSLNNSLGNSTLTTLSAEDDIIINIVNLSKEGIFPTSIVEMICKKDESANLACATKNDDTQIIADCDTHPLTVVNSTFKGNSEETHVGKEQQEIPRADVTSKMYKPFDMTKKAYSENNGPAILPEALGTVKRSGSIQGRFPGSLDRRKDINKSKIHLPTSQAESRKESVTKIEAETKIAYSGVACNSSITNSKSVKLTNTEIGIDSDSVGNWIHDAFEEKTSTSIEKPNSAMINKQQHDKEIRTIVPSIKDAVLDKKKILQKDSKENNEKMTPTADTSNFLERAQNVKSVRFDVMTNNNIRYFVDSDLESEVGTYASVDSDSDMSSISHVRFSFVRKIEKSFDKAIEDSLTYCRGLEEPLDFNNKDGTKAENTKDG
eukprot:CAMPEP_0194281850 /NCGR_PEP_ID=MMETSP0169-20130528/21707_1 /TAXON_ID=218684 /ORGANISM="Corethron pennatum, Strain L29A3" /LENGTH=871 /DNA_ID=CAMNT_0039027021 /DNA_START=22 /DNA_END=2633 /DNA_ORIENTATION=-